MTLFARTRSPVALKRCEWLIRSVYLSTCSLVGRLAWQLGPPADLNQTSSAEKCLLSVEFIMRVSSLNFFTVGAASHQ
jgi:hypothetical protein